jgi:hypothetical protein
MRTELAWFGFDSWPMHLWGTLSSAAAIKRDPRREYWIFWFIEGHAFLRQYDLAPLSFSVFLCVAGRTYWREKGWGSGRGAESYNREIACPSINHSILSGVLRIILHFPLVAIILYTKSQKYSQNDSYSRVELPFPFVSTVVWGAKLCLCENSRIRFPNSSYLELVGERETATDSDMLLKD